MKHEYIPFSILGAEIALALIIGLIFLVANR